MRKGTFIHKLLIKENWLLLTFLLTTFFGFTQSDSVTLEKKLTIDVIAKSATTDQFGNIYLIVSNNEIRKYNPEGDELFRYSNSRLGEITYFDVSNPFNLLVFFEAFNTIKFLDRTLSETGEFHLFNAGLFNAKCMSVADDKHLWIFDKDNFQLKKFSFDGRLVVQSQQLNQLLQKNLNPTIIKEIGNRVYLYDKKEGILVFDILGKFLHYFPYKGIVDFEVAKNRLFIFKDKKLTLVDMNFSGTKDVNYHFPKLVTRFGKRIYSNNHLLHIREEKVDIYQIQ